MIPVLAAVLIAWLPGLCVTAILLRHDRETGLLERLCLAYPLGMGLVAVQLFFLGLFRVPLTQAYATAPVIAEIAAAAIWIGKNKITLFPKPSLGLLKELASPDTSWLKKAALGVLTCWFVLKLGSVFVETYLTPISGWDDRAHWSVAAKLFYFAHNLLLDVPQAEFFGRGVGVRYTSNPLLNPLSQVWLGLWAGSFDEVLVKLSSPFYLLATAVYLYCIAGREMGRLAALGMAVIFLSSPLMSYHAAGVYSDFPLGVYIFFAAASFLAAMRGKQGFWPLVGMFSALALFTKNEAPGMILPLLLSAVVYIAMSKKYLPARRALVSLVLPLALVAPWFAFKQVYALSLVHDDQQLRFLYQPGVAGRFFEDTLTLRNFNVFLVALPLLALVKGRLSREVLHILVPLVCYATFFVMVYSFMPGYYQWAFTNVNFFRNTLTLYPTVCLLTMLLIAGLLKESADLKSAEP